MWIKLQCGDHLVDCQNPEIKEVDGKFHIIAEAVTTKRYLLGSYDSIVRATEILQELKEDYRMPKK